MTISAVLKMPWVQGAVSGTLSAAAVDYHAFTSWKKWQDALHYDWSTASFRWLQGFVIGALTGAGLGAMFS
jgi:hypothetical protein